MTRWGDDDFYGSAGKLQRISGERFLGWDSAVGAGARAMGLSAAV
jgi:repressor of RNA polymerase III transcription MAF1